MLNLTKNTYFRIIAITVAATLFFDTSRVAGERFLKEPLPCRGLREGHLRVPPVTSSTGSSNERLREMLRVAAEESNLLTTEEVECLIRVSEGVYPNNVNSDIFQRLLREGYILEVEGGGYRVNLEFLEKYIEMEKQLGTIMPAEEKDDSQLGNLNKKLFKSAFKSRGSHSKSRRRRRKAKLRKERINSVIGWALASLAENKPALYNKDLSKKLRHYYYKHLLDIRLKDRLGRPSISSEAVSFFYLLMVKLSTLYLLLKYDKTFEKEDADINVLIISAWNVINAYWSLTKWQRECVHEISDYFNENELTDKYHSLVILCDELSHSSPNKREDVIIRYIKKAFPKMDRSRFNQQKIEYWLERLNGGPSITTLTTNREVQRNI